MVGAITSYLRHLEIGLEKAKRWLKNRGLRSFDVNRKTEDTVRRTCPHYPEFNRLLGPPTTPPVDQVEKGNVRCNGDASCDEERATGLSVHGEDVEELPKRGSKRKGVSPHVFRPKEIPEPARIAEKWYKIELEDSKCVTVLQPEPNERREFFKLELQVKRDEALIVRAKARKQLRETGVSSADIDRLLPLM